MTAWTGEGVVQAGNYVIVVRSECFRFGMRCTGSASSRCYLSRLIRLAGWNVGVRLIDCVDILN
jgi:hypothetical protein